MTQADRRRPVGPGWPTSQSLFLLCYHKEPAWGIKNTSSDCKISPTNLSVNVSRTPTGPNALCHVCVSRLSSAGRQQRGTHGGGGLGGVQLPPPAQRHHQPQGHRLHRWVVNAASNCYTKATFPHCFHGGLIQNPLASARRASPSACLHHVHPGGTILLCSGLERHRVVLFLVAYGPVLQRFHVIAAPQLYKKNKCLYYFCFSCSQPPAWTHQSMFGSSSLFLFVVFM